MLLREAGELRVPIGAAGKFRGDLWLKMEKPGSEERSVQVLQLLTGGGKQPLPLFDPKVTYLTAGSIKFLGYERVGRAWCVQEWSCEIARD